MPGLSVTAAHADTPQSPSPRRSVDVAAAATAARPSDEPPAMTAALAAAAPQLATAAPLAKPTLRVQGGDIILEDATSPQAASAPQGAFASQPGGSGLADGDGAARPSAVADAQQQQQQQQQGDVMLGPRLMRKMTSGDASRALAASRQSTQQVGVPAAVAAAAGPGGAAEAAVHRLQHQQGADGALATATAEAAGRGPLPVARHRSTLTEENVAYANKLGQYSGRADPAERMWRWLEGSGPPFDVQPSLGVPPPPSRSASAAVLAAKRQPGRRRLWCGCFGGG